MAKILSKFGEQQLVIVNYACGLNQSETGKYFEWMKYLLLTEFEGRTVSYGPSFFLLDLWPKREAR